MILFDKRKFIAVYGEKGYEFSKKWVDKCHAKEVVNGRCGRFLISDNWIVDTDNLVFSLEEYDKSGVRHAMWADRCEGEPIKVDADGDLVVVGKNGVTYQAALDWCVEKVEKEEAKVNESKYKVGDKVVVREDLEVGELYGNVDFVDAMKEFKGKVVTLEAVVTNGRYTLVEDKHTFKYRWTDEMFVGLAGSKALLQSGDVVTTRKGNKYLAVATGNRMVLMNADGNGHMPLDSYDNNLICKSGNDEYDVMSIHRPTIYGFNGAFKRIKDSNLIWERKEQPEAEPTTEPNEQQESETIIDGDIKELIDLLFEMVK